MDWLCEYIHSLVDGDVITDGDAGHQPIRRQTAQEWCSLLFIFTVNTPSSCDIGLGSQFLSRVPDRTRRAVSPSLVIIPYTVLVLHQQRQPRLIFADEFVSCLNYIWRFTVTSIDIILPLSRGRGCGQANGGASIGCEVRKGRTRTRIIRYRGHAVAISISLGVQI